jgi:hypothetical protein
MQKRDARLLAMVFGIWGCAGAGEQRQDDSPLSGQLAGPAIQPKAPSQPYRPGEMPVGLGNEKDEDVELDFDQGYFNQGDVNEILEQHTTRLTGCYERAGGATKFAGGIVKLRFLVGPDGVVRDVLVIDTEIGNYPVERCLVVEGRKIPFPKPGGGSGADFEYSLEFRSSKQTHVVDWQKDVLRKRVLAKLPSLGRCGNPGLGDRPVAAVAYISPRGSIVSVGLASAGQLDTMAAMCVVEEIHKWRFAPRADRGQLVRTIFPLYRGRPGALTMRRAAQRRPLR